MESNGIPYHNCISDMELCVLILRLLIVRIEILWQNVIMHLKY
jgi:hypothetical protein